VDRYTGVGLALTVFGAVFAVFSHFVLYEVVFTALGMASVILGASLFLVPGSPVPYGAVRAMVEASALNVEALLEEFDAKRRAYYLPPRDGRVYCYVPLGDGFDERDLGRVLGAPLRVVSGVAGLAGLMVFPPGAEVVRMAEVGEESGLEDALSYVLVDFLEAVDRVKVAETGDNLVVELSGSKLGTVFNRVNMCLGSSAVSVAGCVASWVLGVPVVYVEEYARGRAVVAHFRVVGLGEE
jgi:hypothetical protein